MIFLQTTGIVTLTLLINGTTAGIVYKKLQVYPPSPFRPALATQGLRNIQAEVDKMIHALRDHWFHCNVDMDIILKLVPNFSEAYMLDGDLVDVKSETLDSAWLTTADQMLAPIPFLSTEIQAAVAEGAGLMIAEVCKPGGDAGADCRSSVVGNVSPGNTSPRRSHGHGGSHAEQLQNIRKWLDNSDSVIESTFPMYDIMLTSMKSHFVHMREGRMIGVKTYNFLNTAVGRGLDHNDAQMHAYIAKRNQQPDRMSRMDSMVQNKDSPIDACADYVIDYASNGLKRSRMTSDEHVVFGHRMLCAEMFMALIEQLNALGSADSGDDSDLAGFRLNATECCKRCKLKLAEMQIASPNTFRACHTVLGFNLIASEFHHRIHAYEDQGFFTADLVAAAEFEMEGRARELAQFFKQWPILSNLALFKSDSHPVFYVYDVDRSDPSHIAPPAAAPRPMQVQPLTLPQPGQSQPAQLTPNAETDDREERQGHDSLVGSESLRGTEQSEAQVEQTHNPISAIHVSDDVVDEEIVEFDEFDDDQSPTSGARISASGGVTEQTRGHTVGFQEEFSVDL